MKTARRLFRMYFDIPITRDGTSLGDLHRDTTSIISLRLMVDGKPLREGVLRDVKTIGRAAFVNRRASRQGCRAVWAWLADAWHSAMLDDVPGAMYKVALARAALSAMAQAPDVERGRKFKPAGRGKGKLRILVEREITGLDGLSARQAWNRLGDMSARKRKSIEFYDDHAYLPGEPTVSFRRFENLLSEIRRARR